MLDNSFLECTLTADSTGHECLDGIAQKIELQEIHYFGLRYVTKKLQLRWVDLSKPLKKQLEKYAQTSHANRSPRLYFGVMFYISSAHKIVDDVARYQYYLQLKNDITDGRLPLDMDQVIRLAAYSLQVEFNDFESDRSSSDYFTDNIVFPKSLMRDENILQGLKNEVLHMYTSLQGMHPVKAEIEYMKEIQMLDGYGMEYYIAKDEQNQELYLGTSYEGIFARYLGAQLPVFVKWADIVKLQQSKKIFEIDVSKNSVQYTMEDSDTAKYLKRMSLLQQKFYKTSTMNLRNNSQPSAAPQIDVAGETLMQSQNSLSSLKYGDQKYEQDSRSASVNTEDFYSHSQPSLHLSAQDLTSTGQYQHQERRASSASNYKQQQIHHQTMQNMSGDQAVMDLNYANPLAALPAYRQAPDYETVMKRKMMNQSQQIGLVHSHVNNSQQQIHSTNQSEEALAYSQPEIGSISHGMSVYSHEGQYQLESPVRNYGHSMAMYTSVFQDQTNYMPYRVAERTTNLSLQPTYSSPELNTQGLPQDYANNSFLNVNDTYVYHYKPPPPYPRTSNSTPDLVVQTALRECHESQDLVSKPLGDSAFNIRSNLHRSVENLTDTIPEVVQLSENTVETESGIAEVECTHLAKLDDASNNLSESTFHNKDSDSEAEEQFIDAMQQRNSSKSKITVRFVAPNKAPPPSTSMEVATKRESFKRLMIARSGSFTTGVLRQNSMRLTQNNRSLRAKEKNCVEEHMVDTSKCVNKSDGSDTVEELAKDPVIENVKNVLNRVTQSSALASDNFIENISQASKSKEVSRSQSDTKHTNKVTVVHEKSISLDSSSERQQLLDKLKLSDTEIPITIKENDVLVRSRDQLVDCEESDSDMDEVPKSPMGPLKLAAMNGLTMSRPMMLALMNDETRAPKDERRKLLERKLSENLVFKEFEETHKRVDFDCNVAKLPENALRNRFKDVLPYDCTRVKLNPRKDNSSGYINASHIKLTVGHRLWWYIAAQAPMDTTLIDFWQMIWEQEVEVIAMLTALMELGRPKCYPYWPQEPGPKHKLIFGDYEVQLLFSNDSLCYITNSILLRHIPSKKDRQIWHLQYTDWPDHGCPEDVYGFLGFIDEIESVQRLAESEEGSGKKSPVVVHCSAGVGRTGVVILTQVMKWCLEYNQEIDLPKALGLIRHQRMHMVQTLGQYNFIHKTLIQYLKNTRLI